MHPLLQSGNLWNRDNKISRAVTASKRAWILLHKWISFARFCKIMWHHSGNHSLETRGNRENRKAIWKTHNWGKILAAFKAIKQLQGCCQCSPLSTQQVCIVQNFCNIRWADEFLVGTNAPGWTTKQRVTSCNYSDWWPRGIDNFIAISNP